MSVPASVFFNLGAVATRLKGYRLPVDTEVALQAEISRILTAHGPSFEAEARLDAKSRIDFLIHPGIGLEAKIGGGRREIWRQLQRYARLDAIQALILVGTVAFPSSLIECEGKPFRFVSVGRGWL